MACVHLRRIFFLLLMYILLGTSWANASSCQWVNRSYCAPDSDPHGAFCDIYNCYCGPDFDPSPNVTKYRCNQPVWICPNCCRYLLTETVSEYTCQCDISVPSFQGSPETIEPGGSVTFSGVVTEPSAVSWTISLPNGAIVNGTGKTPSASWNGKDKDGNVVSEGTYTATLTTNAVGGYCSATQNAQVTVKSCCTLNIISFT
ncbi:MAG TPA: hypothetical protein VFR01_03745, partial [Geobacterales bacterium]|nr:hypothetical protein [Geobacterales bacterium]